MDRVARSARAPARHWLGAAAGRVLLSAGAWWAVTEGEPRGPLLGAAVVLATALTSLWTLPPGALRIRPAGALRFVPYFVRVSLAGGWDVAKRALGRRKVAPVWIDVPVRLIEPRAQAFLAGLICLVPGSLSARVDGMRLRVHALDRRMPVRASVAEAESRVADLFGLDQPRA